DPVSARSPRSSPRKSHGNTGVPSCYCPCRHALMPNDLRGAPAASCKTRWAMVTAVALLALERRAAAKDWTGLFDSASSGPHTRRFALEDLLRGWEGFTDVWLMADMAMVLLLAVLLGAVIAYHPLTRSKAASLEELEQPK